MAKGSEGGGEKRLKTQISSFAEPGHDGRAQQGLAQRLPGVRTNLQRANKGLRASLGERDHFGRLPFQPDDPSKLATPTIHCSRHAISGEKLVLSRVLGNPIATPAPETPRKQRSGNLYKCIKDNNLVRCPGADFNHRHPDSQSSGRAQAPVPEEVLDACSSGVVAGGRRTCWSTTSMEIRPAWASVGAATSAMTASRVWIL